MKTSSDSQREYIKRTKEARHKGDVDAVAGLGTPGADASDTVFAYQAGAGASYDLGNNVALFGGYRYLGTSDADFDGIETDYSSAHFW